MERILVVVSVDLLAEACFLLDHHVRPPRTARTATAMISPFGFMSYLRFHQVPRPMPTTASGKNTTLSRNMVRALWAFTLSGWLEGSLGRIEIKSSSAESQFIMFRNRSRLPLNRISELPTQVELPTTTKRPLLLYMPA